MPWLRPAARWLPSLLSFRFQFPTPLWRFAPPPRMAGRPDKRKRTVAVPNYRTVLGWFLKGWLLVGTQCAVRRQTSPSAKRSFLVPPIDILLTRHGHTRVGVEIALRVTAPRREVKISPRLRAGRPQTPIRRPPLARIRTGRMAPNGPRRGPS